MKSRRPIYIVSMSIIALCIVGLILTPVLGRDSASTRVEIARDIAMENVPFIDITEGELDLIAIAEAFHMGSAADDPASRSDLLPEGAVYTDSVRYKDSTIVEYEYKDSKVLLTKSRDSSTVKTVIAEYEDGTIRAYENADNAQYSTYNY